MKVSPSRKQVLKVTNKDGSAESYVWYDPKVNRNRLDFGFGNSSGYMCLSFGPDMSNAGIKMRAFIDMVKANENKLCSLADSVVDMNADFEPRKKFTLPKPVDTDDLL